MRAYDLILKKRNGKALERHEIEYLIKGYVNGNIEDYQISALLMAIFFNHLNDEETFFLTECMRYSGDTIDLGEIPGIKVDKHSTGGVGDKTTLALAPMVASCGVKVAKLSGRGLGHTGGTIDKLEAIPGFNTSIKMTDFIKQVNSIGIALAGQTANLVPADKKLYSLRDVTATVDEPSLIASSIISKKLASGADAFVLDVKVGSGAFMKNLEEAKKLAQIMVKIAKKADKNACALLTNMDQPLGNKIGNALEVIEAVDTLKGNGPEDFTQLCIALGKYMLKFAFSIDLDEAEKRIKNSISSGEALAKFKELIEAQQGQADFIDDPYSLLNYKGIHEFKSSVDGYVQQIDTQKVGIAAMILGAGRERKEDHLDFSVGFDFLKKTGDRLDKDDTIIKMYYNDEAKLGESLSMLEKAVIISDKYPIEKKQLIFDIIS